ncbi:MAG: hypothetical protein ACJ0BT_00360 [Pseudohongiellaceae bacterium]
MSTAHALVGIRQDQAGRVWTHEANLSPEDLVRTIGGPVLPVTS